MAIITPPAPLPLRSVRWRLSVPMQVNRSAWTNTSKKVGLPGAQLWSVSGQFVTQIGETRAKPWRAFFLSLRGQANAFPVLATENFQTSTSGPTVRTGATAGTTLPLQGLPASTTVLRTGDMMTVQLTSGHQRLVMLMGDLVSNGSGQATAVFEPELGEVPVIGSTVEIQWPFGLMSLTSDPPGWDVDVGQLYAFTLSAEEAR